MKTAFYTLSEVCHDRYLKCPKDLLFDPTYRQRLDSNSILLYAILLDRLELSRKNNWVEKDGEQAPIKQTDGNTN